MVLTISNETSSAELFHGTVLVLGFYFYEKVFDLLKNLFLERKSRKVKGTVTLRADLAWLLAFTKSFAWLVCRVVGLFTPRLQDRNLCSQGRVL